MLHISLRKWSRIRRFMFLQEILGNLGYFLFQINLQFSCNKIVLVLGRYHFVVLWKNGEYRIINEIFGVFDDVLYCKTVSV